MSDSLSLPEPGNLETLDIIAESLRYHDQRYFQQDQPEISDAEYDRLRAKFDRLAERFDQAASRYPDLMQRVGAAPAPGFAKIAHMRPMRSLDKTYEQDGVRAWMDKIRSNRGQPCPGFIVQPKLDGLALSLIYEGGQLVRAVTRGDGREGEDVTAQARQVSAIPDRLFHPHWDMASFRVEVRGEVCIPLDAFTRLNEDLQASGQDPFSHPRNAAAGSLRQSDPAVTARRGLVFRPYDLFLGDRQEAITLLEASGFIEPASITFEDRDDFEHVCDFIRDKTTLPIDGLVFSVASPRIREAIEAGTDPDRRAPKWAIAFKFPAVGDQTRLIDIVWEISRHGTLSPVARLEPVILGGSKIRRASLHNASCIHERNIAPGCMVTLEKAGDVIPHVRAGDHAGPPCPLPTICPCCGAPVAQSGEDLVCTDPDHCPGVKQRRMEHFVSRAGLNIPGLGSQKLASLITAKDRHGLPLAGSPTLLLSLPERVAAGDIADLDGWGETSARNLITAIRAARQDVKPERFLVAFGIPGIGESTARDLARIWGPDIASILQAIEKREAGNPAASWLTRNRAALQSCVDLITFARSGKPKRSKSEPGPLSGEVIAFTGSLTGMTRKEAAARAKSLGATVRNNISRDLTMLVNAGDSTRPSNKVKAAETRGVRILTDAGFMDLIKGGQAQ